MSDEPATAAEPDSRPVDRPQPVGTPGERVFSDTVGRMLSDRGYLLPLTAAQRQFRDAYYGMSAAALLEDLFFDALSNYLHQSAPTMTLDRPGRGQKGWDYQLDGTAVSHKVGRGPTEIAALWDATRTDLTHWSFESAVMFISSEYAPRRIAVSVGNESVSLQPLSGRADEAVKRGHGLVALRWGADNRIEILGHWQASHDTAASELVGFGELWSVVSASIARGVAANEIEVLHAPPGAAGLLGWLLEVAERGEAAYADPRCLRPGAYLFPRAALQEIPVTTNNRAVLLSRETVAGLMHAAVAAGCFAPIPTWFATWAPARPPNLYLTQRAQYDQMFSA